jgi:hypothetical protein
VGSNFREEREMVVGIGEMELDLMRHNVICRFKRDKLLEG